MTATTFADLERDFAGPNARLDALLARIDWPAYATAEHAYLTWAYRALADTTAYACDLPDAAIAALQADLNPYPDTKHRLWNPRARAADVAERNSTWIVEHTSGNLERLHHMGGWQLRDVGYAVLAQALVDPDVTAYLAGPWLRAGHPFPTHPRVTWDQYPAGDQ